MPGIYQFIKLRVSFLRYFICIVGIYLSLASCSGNPATLRQSSIEAAVYFVFIIYIILRYYRRMIKQASITVYRSSTTAVV